MIRTEFSHRSLHGAPRGRRRLLIATVVVLLVFAVDFATGGSIRSGARSAAAYAWSMTLAARTTVRESGYFARQSQLARENSLLRSELASARERASAANVLKQENELLRSMLHLSQSSPGITAPVVSSFSASPYGTFMVSAGKSDGIAKGDLVLSEGGFAVGRVVDVQENTTLVSGIFASGSSIDVVVGSAAVTAIGEGGGNARVSIPRGIAVAIGDAVVSPSLGSRAVGIVGNVEDTPTSAEQKIYISLPTNLSLMRYVFIIPAHE